MRIGSALPPTYSLDTFQECCYIFLNLKQIQNCLHGERKAMRRARISRLQWAAIALVLLIMVVTTGGVVLVMHGVREEAETISLAEANSIQTERAGALPTRNPTRVPLKNLGPWSTLPATKTPTITITPSPYHTATREPTRPPNLSQTAFVATILVTTPTPIPADTHMATATRTLTQDVTRTPLLMPTDSSTPTVTEIPKPTTTPSPAVTPSVTWTNSPTASVGPPTPTPTDTPLPTESPLAKANQNMEIAPTQQVAVYIPGKGFDVYIGALCPQVEGDHALVNPQPYISGVRPVKIKDTTCEFTMVFPPFPASKLARKFVSK